jgi:hypothetical protein
MASTNTIPTVEDHAERVRVAREEFVRVAVAASMSDDDLDAVIKAAVRMACADASYGWERGYDAGVENGRKYEKMGW